MPEQTKKIETPKAKREENTKQISKFRVAWRDIGLVVEFYINMSTSRKGQTTVGRIITSPYGMMNDHVEKTTCVHGDVFDKDKGIRIVAHKLVSYMKSLLHNAFLKQQKQLDALCDGLVNFENFMKEKNSQKPEMLILQPAVPEAVEKKD